MKNSLMKLASVAALSVAVCGVSFGASFMFVNKSDQDSVLSLGQSADFKNPCSTELFPGAAGITPHGSTSPFPIPEPMVKAKCGGNDCYWRMYVGTPATCDASSTVVATGTIDLAGNKITVKDGESIYLVTKNVTPTMDTFTIDFRR